MSGFQPLRPEEFTRGSENTEQGGSVVPLPALRHRPPATVDDEREIARQQGFEQGMQQAAQQAELLIASLQAAERQQQQDLVSRAEELEKEAARLAVTLACEMTDHLVQVDQSRLEAMAKGLLAAQTEAPEITLRVHPEDASLFEAMNLQGVRQVIHIQSDPDIQRGGCMLTSSLGDVDAQPSVRQEHLREKLGELLGEA